MALSKFPRIRGWKYYPPFEESLGLEGCEKYTSRLVKRNNYSNTEHWKTLYANSAS